MTDQPSSPPTPRRGDGTGRTDKSSGNGAASALEHLRELEASKARLVTPDADDGAQAVPAPPPGSQPPT